MVTNSLIDKNKIALGAIESKELKLMEKFDAFKNFVEGALPNSSKETVAWFVSNAITEVKNNKALMEAAKVVPNQFFGALMKSIQLGLPIGNQYRVASLIPRSDKNTGKSISLQLWTRAYKMLVARTEKYSEIQVRAIYEKDDLKILYEDGIDSFSLKPTLWEDKGKKLGYIAYCRNLKTNNPIFRLYNLEFIQKRRELAKTDIFWNKWEEEMEIKTVIGDFCKNWLDTEIEIQKYLATEEKAYSLNVDADKPEIEEIETTPTSDNDESSLEVVEEVNAKPTAEDIKKAVEAGREKMTEKIIKDSQGKNSENNEVEELFKKQ